jgi:outer membrane lipoprotein LolB
LTGQFQGRIAAIATLLALAGCASLSAPPGSARFPEARDTYQVAGRLSVRHEDDAFAASFRWSHSGDRDELDLSTPLGQTLARLIGDARGVELRRSDGSVETANDWTTLTSRGLGWALPVSGLSFWIQGSPRKGAPFTVESTSDGNPGVLRQDGWIIAYQTFAKDPSGASRPTRMTLDYPGVALRLVIDTWQ